MWSRVTQTDRHVGLRRRKESEPEQNAVQAETRRDEDEGEGGVVTDYSHLLPQRSADEKGNREFQPLEGSQ